VGLYNPGIFPCRLGAAQNQQLVALARYAEKDPNTGERRTQMR
jgi:hypothetical protein